MRNLIVLHKVNYKIGVRFLSSVAELSHKNESNRSYGRMSGWQIHSYSNQVDELMMSENLTKPHIQSPSQLLVKVTASSVNPIDTAMMNGYGSTLLNTMRCSKKSDIEFPLTLGRDFVGTIVNKGMMIDNKEYKIGDKIWGVVPVHHQGCHSEFIAIDKCFVSKKPENLSDIDASAILYAGLTAWSGLFVTGQLGGTFGALCNNHKSSDIRKVLILGASGGVGSLAAQILLAENVEVVASCSTDAVPLIQNLGIQKVVDYKTENSDAILVSESPYDIILDCAGKGTKYANKLPWEFRNFITFSSPLLKNFDSHGLFSGSFLNIRDLINANMPGNGRVKWGYFVPSQVGIQYLKNLAEKQKLLPIIDSVFGYDQLPAAYQKCLDGHLRGKVVIDYTKKIK